MSSKKSEKKLLWLMSDRGFGSEVNNLLYAINFSKKKGFQILILTSCWNFGITNGWSDFFTSLSEQTKLFSNKRTKLLLLFLHKNIGVSRLIYWEKKQKKNSPCQTNKTGVKGLIYSTVRTVINLIKPKNIKFIYEKFDEVREFNIRERKSSNYEFLQEMNKILKEVWEINASTQSKINQIKIKINDEYAVFHIRRGDKITSEEDTLYEVDIYMKKLEQVNPSIKKVFVMSDDYRSFTELKERYPKTCFLTLVDKNELGHQQKEFNRKTATQREKSAVVLLTELEIAVEGKVFIGSRKSNIFRLVEYLKAKECIDISDDRPNYFI